MPGGSAPDALMFSLVCHHHEALCVPGRRKTRRILCLRVYDGGPECKTLELISPMLAQSDPLAARTLLGRQVESVGEPYAPGLVGHLKS